MMRSAHRTALAFLIACVPAGLSAQDPATGEEIDFLGRIRPILESRCFDCHGPDAMEGGLRLSRRETAFAGGDSGHKAIVPGKPGESRLIKLVSGQDPELRMPPEDAGDPLSAEEVAELTSWIEQGADWPAEGDVETSIGSHWAWRKPIRPPLPAVADAAWPKNDIDRFILQRLEQEGLSPTAQADRYTLIRRVSLDLIGLPPTPEQVERFVNDARSDAYELLVDDLLADPAYGERWARMWLDLARYADSKGYGSDPLRSIWRYRDWVIEAFNRNLTYDQFTIEQLAGDLLDEPTMDQILATAFHRNTMANDEGGTDDEEFRVAAIKDRVDTTAQIWMGITLGCAKCHSHKFDPFSNREYYQFYAFFNQTEDADRGDETPRLPTPTRDQLAEIDRLTAQRTALTARLDSPLLDTPEFAAAQAAWEDEARQAEGMWKPLDIVESSTTGGTQLVVHTDGSLIAEGESPDSETHRIVARTNLAGVTGLRLEALADSSLPGGGPGRSGSGNFVLNEVRVRAAGREAKTPEGRFVRIEIPAAGQILSLAEVQVFRGGENIAGKGTATQSSVDHDGRPELAIDGNMDGHYFNGKSVTHTSTEDNPWWELDLGESQSVERIALYNRTDNGLETRLSNFKISLLDSARQPVWSTTIADPPRPSLTQSLDGASAVELRNASADVSQEGFSVAAAIDGKAETGWAIAPEFGRPHVAVFEPTQPIGSADGATLTFELVQSHGSQHTLGRFRLSATSALPPPHPIPAAIAELLAITPANRSREQSDSVARYYWGVSREAQVIRDEIAALDAQRTAIEQAIPTTPILRELAADQRRTTQMLIKGNFKVTGDTVEAAVPSAFHPLPSGAPANRLGVARWLVDRENPLTARVAVNRFWSQLFGLGLVESEEDFGTQGLSPNHPELLDWLAVEFMDRGWDVKALLKLMVTSATYRQSSVASPDLLARDAANRLLARGPRFRLEAEMVRDQALAISGLLSHKQGGPSVYPPQPEGLWRAAFNGERTWATSAGEDRYRRGLYTYWRRTIPYPSMATFDAPSREICTLRRFSTNTPLQAFVTLNDPAFVEAAQALARRIVREGGASPEDRAAFGLRLCLARPAHPEQVGYLVSLYTSELENYRGNAEAAAQIAAEPLGPLPEGADPAELAAWTVVGNVLLNLDGVLSKR